MAGYRLGPDYPYYEILNAFLCGAGGEGPRRDVPLSEWLSRVIDESCRTAMGDEEGHPKAYDWQIRSIDGHATGRLEIASANRPPRTEWSADFAGRLEHHRSWATHRYYQPNARHVVLRISPESADVAERRFLFECVTPGLKDLGDHGSEFHIRLRAYLRLCLFGDSLQQLCRELRQRLETAFRGSGVDGVAPDEVLKYFDLIEWFRDGSKRLREEEWRGHASAHRILQPSVPPLSTPQHWRARRRLASPETMAYRIALGTAAKVRLAESLNPERMAKGRGAIPETWEAGEQAINAWLALLKESRTGEDLQSVVRFMTEHAAPAALAALRTWVEPNGAVGGVKVRGAWARGRLAVKLLERIQARIHGVVPGTEDEQQLLVQDLGLVVLDALYERKRDLENEEADGIYPHLPCDPRQFTQALIRMVALYAHRIVGVPYEIPIVPALREVFDLEAVFYLVKPRYRNHLYHVIDVAMLGEFLIELGLQPFSGVDGSKWWVAALFHDIGYLAESVNFMPGYLDSLGGDVFRQVNADLCSAVEKAKNGIACYAKENMGLPEGPIEADHGVASAIHLSQQMAALHINRQDYQEAIIAIAWHAADRPKVDAESHPLAALLLLCDELQEWQRGVVRAADIRQRLASAVIFGESAAQWINTMETLTISLSDSRLQIDMRYGDLASTEYDPIEIWIGKLKALERITWPKDVNVDLSIEVRSSRAKGNRCSDMGLLRQSIDRDPKLLSLRTLNDLLYRGEELKHSCVAADRRVTERLSVALSRIGRMREWVIPRGSEVWKHLLYWRRTAWEAISI